MVPAAEVSVAETGNTAANMAAVKCGPTARPRSGGDPQKFDEATIVVRPEGIEPPAYRFEACRSIQLSYGRPGDPYI